MNIDSLNEKLKSIQDSLQSESVKLQGIAKNLYETTFDDPRDEQYSQEQYFSYLDKREQIYQQKNKEYKELISGFSDAYLEICDFYVGPELPREHEQTLLDSKEDINTLYFMFMMSLFLKE